MGCAESRDRSDEQELEEFEKGLKFSNYTIGQIKEAFFRATGNSVISGSHLEKSLEQLGIDYNIEQRAVFNRFMQAFLAYEDDGQAFYDVMPMLTALFVLSKSNQTEKSSALFDLYDANFSNSLSKIEIETAFCRICDVVFAYSEKILENDESMINLHQEIMMKRRDEVIGKAKSLFFAGRDELSRENFLKMISQISKSTELVDFTDPRSIRQGLMDFLFKGRLTQLQIQQNYVIKKSLRIGNAFVATEDVKTRDNSLENSDENILTQN